MSKLVIKNGRVVDPAQNLDHVARFGYRRRRYSQRSEMSLPRRREDFDATG